jgi:hypothetical protein
MHAKPPAPLRTPFTRMAVALSLVALVAAVAAYAFIEHAGRSAAAVTAQSALADAYGRRALRCLDVSEAALGDPAGAERARRSLNISGGITLCLVKARDDARLDEDVLAACIARVEAANAVPAADATSATRPAC